MLYRPYTHSFASKLGLLFVVLFIYGLTSTCLSLRTSALAQPSPTADVSNDLICHPEDPADCYPKIFKPTFEFQAIKPGQDIPYGLHVQLNVATGEKLAKINVPEEANPALEGLPVDRSVVVVDPQEPKDHHSRFRQPANAPAYDPAGKIKDPAAVAEGDPNDDAGAFYNSLAVLRKGLDVDGALEMLEDISHDIYYGLKIAEDWDTVRQLFCLANTGDIFASSAEGSTQQRARLAALTLASSVQNNPKALAEIERYWPRLRKEVCPSQDASSSLSTSTFRLVSDPLLLPSHDHLNNNPTLAKARITALNGLLRSPLIRSDFLSEKGLDRLLEVLVFPETWIPTDSASSSAADVKVARRAISDAWAPAQRKAAQLVLDNFLDEDMGAAVGEWPAGAVAKSEKECRTERDEWRGVDGGCWKAWARTLAGNHKDGWAKELADKL